ncbi:MFS transporter [Actinokineospora auranticolor]|uniref:MFS transporter n=1 Tax=Actinokineospora auranticolor TaxID=155976 RepID=A0A2S6GTN1_9PSEU|nr:MFS transporter [Actinokineospora auranticolor]PPK68481.1 MFS transporter [Actinokineospora auranticolor]
MTTKTVLSAARPPAARGSSPGAVLAVMCAATMLVLAFVAAINLAVPDLAASALRPSSAELLWVVDSYVALFACLVIPCGALGDRLGRKGVLLSGLGLLAVGAAVSAVSTSVPVMLIGRGLAGAGAACVVPNSLAILINATPGPRRAKAIGVWAASTGAGGVLGNVGGGAVLAAGSWRWLFAAVVPLAVVCAGWAALRAPRTDRNPHRLDPAGTVLVTLATLALLVGVIQGPESGWGSVTVIGAFVAAVLLFGVWVVVELRSAHPLLDPRLFRIAELRTGCLGMTAAFFGMFALFYVNATFLRYGMGFDVLTTGLAVIPLTIPILAGARVVPGLTARLGATRSVAAAFGTISVGLFGLSTCAANSPYVYYGLWLVVIGVGVALALPVLTTSIATSLPPEKAGIGAGLQATTREFGSALGVAVIGTILTGHFVSALPEPLRHGPHTVAEALRAAGTSAPLRAQVLEAFGSGANAAMRVIAIITLVAGAVVTAQLAWSARKSVAAGQRS